MNFINHADTRPIRLFLLAGAVLCCTGLRVPAQEIFREFTLNAGQPKAFHYPEIDPKATYDFTKPGSEWALHFHHRSPKTIVLDLAQATRAECSFEYWGGHIATSGQQFQINGHGWVDLPQPVGTPKVPQLYHRTLLGNNAVPVPLAYLLDGKNALQFAAGPQIAYNFGMGFYWIYDCTVRVYYNESRPHPTGEIVSPQAGDTFGETLKLEARASSPNGPIVRVEFIGEYDDFDWDGNGVWREWQFTTQHGVLQHHLGTATHAPWQVTFDGHWLPDQSRPIRVRARITDASGITYLTPPMERIVQKRIGRSVRMFKPSLVPERFASRFDHKVSHPCIIPVDGDLAKAKSARLVLSTWSANVDDNSIHEIRLNGQQLANRFGEMHNYSFNSLDVPLDRIKPGANEITLFSTFKGHAIEVNWPGPVLLVEYE